MAVLLTELKNKYTQLRGFHTNRHIVVIESDDWGSIRMPSKETFRKLQEVGDCPSKDPFLSNDCLESELDLRNLYAVLEGVRDMRGKPAVITANFAVANPDFERINKISSFYAYESIIDTYKRYYPEEDVLRVIQDGISSGVFFPQLHCREHMNVNRWMQALTSGNEDVLIAYQNKMIGINASFTPDNIFGYMDAFNTVCSTDDELAEIITDAARMFEEIFKFKSETFVASCFVWNFALEKQLDRLGIRGIQSGVWQNESCGSMGVYRLRRKLHFTGERNSLGQIYSVRNCNFEPAYGNDARRCAEICLSEIEKSFKAKKPAIISSHRLNFISKINPKNAERNLEALGCLLESLLKKFPETEFMTTPELFRIMEKQE